VTGTIEPAVLTLVSPLQSATCVYYRCRIEGDARIFGGRSRPFFEALERERERPASDLAEGPRSAEAPGP
jgi:hypothetical protein